MNNNLIKLLGTKDRQVGATAFILPLLSLVTLWGVSLCSFIFFLAALYHFRASRSALAHHWREVRWVVGAFALYLLFTLASMLIHPQPGTGAIEQPFRMLAGVSALALVLAFKPDRRYLWWGVAGGALLGAILVGVERFVFDIDRPGGLTNPITTGDVLLLYGLLGLAAAIDMRGAFHSLWLGAGAIAGLAGSLITGTRGGWIALGMAAIVFVLYGQALRSARVRMLVAGSVALVLAAWFIPATGVRARVDQGVADITTYYDGGSAFSNVGIRLELWKGAAMLIAERPLLGIDHPGAKKEMARYVREGKLDAVVLPAEHFHNDMLQVLVVGGFAGLLAWLPILAAPLVFFARVLASRRHAGKDAFAAALAGMLVVVSYFAFGLTEVIFWSVKASLLYALMVFILMGLCLNAKETDGK
ncbi:MAG: O-antigen ligase family protein [Bdellovibrionales bacterium]|nr:O-antigen ligase family protein [Massilia sp.]